MIGWLQSSDDPGPNTRLMHLSAGPTLFFQNFASFELGKVNKRKERIKKLSKLTWGLI
jgi:hypothetical protein